MQSNSKALSWAVLGRCHRIDKCNRRLRRVRLPWLGSLGKSLEKMQEYAELCRLRGIWKASGRERTFHLWNGVLGKLFCGNGQGTRRPVDQLVGDKGFRGK